MVPVVPGVLRSGKKPLLMVLGDWGNRTPGLSNPGEWRIIPLDQIPNETTWAQLIVCSRLWGAIKN